MEFGLALTQFSGKWEHTLGDAVLAEQSGLDSVWFADHLLATTAPAGNAFEAWTALSAVAGQTSRVRLGVLVLAASFRNPGLMAQMAATLDHASRGRLDLGLGAGWYELEYRAFGYDFPSAGDRRRYLEEYVDALRAPLCRRARRLQGSVHHPRPGLLPAGSGPAAVTPIVIGGAKPMMLDLTGRKADVWNCPAGVIPRLAEARAAVLRAADGRTVRTSVQIPVAVGRTADEAAAAVAVGREHMSWMGDIEEIGISGTLDEAAVQVERLAGLGVDALTAVLPGSRRRADFLAAYAELAARF